MQGQTLLRAIFATSLLALGAGACAQAYPAKPVTIIIPFPPGGTLDVVGRMLAQKLGNRWVRPSWSRTGPAGRAPSAVWR